MTTVESSTPPSAESRIGRVLSDRYRILSLLGEGGMGAVYLAEHTLMRKRVALKLLHAEMSENAEVLARFEREAMAAARIEHPNVATATDFGRIEDGSFFLVLEYVEGESLRAVLDRGPLGPARALHVARQMASALARAHEAGIVHRDLKPENVMLVTRGGDPDFVKVLDFGIAKLEAPDVQREGSSAQPLTRLGTILGTPEYMAPEQALGERVTPQSDLYALGVILYEMLTGKHPFDAPDRMAVLSFHIVAPIPPMRDRAPELDVPPIIEAIARRLLEKDAKARPESARALVAEIDQAAASLGFDLARPAPSAPGSAPVMRTSDPGSRPWSAEDSLAQTSHGAALTPQAIAALPTSLAGASPSPTSPSPSPSKSDLARAPGLPAALRSALEAAKTWPRPIQIGVLAAPLVGFVLVLVVVLAMRSSGTASDAATDGGAVTSGGGLLFKKPTTAPPEKLEAASGDPAALEALAKEYPEDDAVVRALALAQHARGETAAALRTVRTLLERKQGADAASPEIVELVVEVATKGKGEDDDEAYALLEGPLGARGVDALMEIGAVATPGGRANATRTRARASLAKPEVRANASREAAVLLDFRAVKECAKKKEILTTRARDDGDARMLATLKPMRSTRGCGFAGLRDCWPCLRDGTLDETIAAIERRLPAATSAEGAGSAKPVRR